MEQLPMKTDEQIQNELKEHRAKKASYARTYRQKNIIYLREYQKQWERENRSVTARKQGRYNKPGIGKLEVRKAEEGEKILVVFD